MEYEVPFQPPAIAAGASCLGIPGTSRLTRFWSPSKPWRRSSSSCAARAARQKPSALSCCLACTRCAQDAWRPRACSALSARRPVPQALMHLPWITSSSRVCSGACRSIGRSFPRRPLAPAAKSQPTSGALSANSSSAPSASRRTNGFLSTRPGH